MKLTHLRLHGFKSFVEPTDFVIERGLTGVVGPNGCCNVQAWPSEANMILVRVTDSKETFEGMKRHGVLIKHVAALHPLLANCLRLTVGTPDENDRMIAALRASL